ncbi:hypothetical protein ACN28I_38785 [Archangium gephyra]|uniref:hypothetical protein n=1 Tax=Archangium gephyra TaxID=48 RepID=UPI003B7A52A5
MKHILDAANLPLQVEYSRETGLSAEHPMSGAIGNGNAIRRALATLSQIPAFAPLVAPILSHKAIASQYSNRLVGPRAELDHVTTQIHALNSAALAFRAALDHALPDEAPTTLAVKIPDPHSLDNLEALVGDLRRFFDIVSKIDDADNPERVEMRPALQAFDSGSFYLELAFSTVTALGVVGVITRAAYNALAIWEQYKQAQARITLTGLAVQEMGSITKHNDALRTALMEGAVNELKKGRFSKLRGEGEAALRAALQQKTEMFEKHIVFLPPATAPNEIHAAFPTYKEIMHLLSGDPTKLIEATNQNNGTTEKPTAKPPKQKDDA